MLRGWNNKYVCLNPRVMPEWAEVTLWPWALTPCVCVCVREKTKPWIKESGQTVVTKTVVPRRAKCHAATHRAVCVCEDLSHHCFHKVCCNQGNAFTALALLSLVSLWSSWLPLWSCLLAKLSFTDLKACDRLKERWKPFISTERLKVDFWLAP